MRSLQQFFNSLSKLHQASRAQTMVCNYGDDYYGDQRCQCVNQDSIKNQPHIEGRNPTR